MNWAATEFESLDLGDPRRNRRAIGLIEKLSAKPTASIPGGRQPEADAIMHQHLHAVGASIGKEVGGVRVGGAKDFDNARQGSRVRQLFGQNSKISNEINDSNR